MRTLLRLIIIAVLGSARAVIVSGGDGTSQDTATGAGTGWNYVGKLNSASGVYLGSYAGANWVLTAGHVGAGSFTLNDVTYAAVGAAISLTNPDGTPVDLALFRIDGSPGLTNLTLASSTPNSFSVVTMIGNGIGRDAAPTVGIGGSSFTGYYWAGSGETRWGKNSVAGTTTITYENSTVTTDTFYTQFSGIPGRAQATTGDSGGGVFTNAGVLAGIMIAVGPLSGQPGSTSVYGEETFIADVASYRTQILGIISAVPVPEPGTFALLIAGGTMLVGRLRRQRG